MYRKLDQKKMSKQSLQEEDFNALRNNRIYSTKINQTGSYNNQQSSRGIYLRNTIESKEKIKDLVKIQQQMVQSLTLALTPNKRVRQTSQNKLLLEIDNQLKSNRVLSQHDNQHHLKIVDQQGSKENKCNGYMNFKKFARQIAQQPIMDVRVIKSDKKMTRQRKNGQNKKMKNFSSVDQKNNKVIKIHIIVDELAWLINLSLTESDLIKYIKMASQYLNTQYQNTSQMNTNNSLKTGDPLIGKLVCKNYIILSKINEGSFGKVYHAIHQIKRDYYAVKVEQPRENKKIGETLRLEAEILKKLNAEKGFPRMFYYVESKQSRILVETLLGKNFEELFTFCKKRFTLKTALMFMEQALNRLEFLHNQGYIHRDIKPENFMIGQEPNQNLIYLIDFGLNMCIYDEKKNHVKQQKGQPLVGTARFTPICSHQGYTQCRASDLESLGYLLIYFIKGTLPWMNVEAASKEERFYMIGQRKMRESPASLGYGLPKEFESFFYYISNLSFDATPSYSYLRKLFRNLFINSHYCNDDIFDWVDIVKNEMVSEKGRKNAHIQEISENSEEDERSKQMNQNGMMQSKESKKSSSFFSVKRSLTCQNHKAMGYSINNLKQDFKLLIEHNKIILDRQLKMNSNLSKSSETEPQENILFTYSDEYYPYPSMSDQIVALPQFILKFNK